MRDVFIIFGACVAAIAVGAFLFFYGVTPQAGNSPGTASFEVIGNGSVAASITASVNFRIKNEDELAALWNLVYDGNKPSLPTVRFPKEEVLAVFDGEHRTGGYGISVVAIKETDTRRTIVVRHTKPDADCATIQGITRPFEIVKVPAAAKALAHEDETVTVACN